jgi:hypothetical protein
MLCPILGDEDNLMTGILPTGVTHPHYVSELISGTKYSLIGRLGITAPQLDDTDDISIFFFNYFEHHGGEVSVVI